MQFRYPFNPLTGLPGDSATPWTNGNPALGIEGSIPPAEALNDPQAEIVHVIDFFLGTGAPGSGQNVADLQQLRKAITASHPKISRYFTDANTTVAYVPGATVETAPVANTFDYVTKFPGKNSTVQGRWGSNYNIANPGHAAGYVESAITNTAGVQAGGNNVIVGGMLANGSHSAFAGSNLFFQMPAGVTTFTLNHRVFITPTTTNPATASVFVDGVEFFFVETLDA